MKNSQISTNRLARLGKQLLFLGIMQILCGCFNPHPKLVSELPVADLVRTYPEKTFDAIDADIDYVPLETTNEALADSDFSVVYVSDNRIVGINIRRGDIFIYGRDGKLISFFNHRGNSGIDYQRIQSIAFDEANKEIFVADIRTSKRCVVYSEEGKFLRQFHFPANSFVTDIYNFDDNTLLVYSDLRPNVGGWIEENIECIDVKMPYVFLSKSDGSLVSRVNISFEKRFSNNHIVSVADGGSVIGGVVATPNRRVKFGRNFVIDDRSADTVYLLTQDKKLTPLFVKTPSVFENKQIAVVSSVHFKMNEHLFFISLEYDVAHVVSLMEKRQSISPAVTNRYFAFDMQSGEVFATNRQAPRGTWMDAPENTVVNTYEASYLHSHRVRGKLAELAKTVKEEDNHVLEIIKYK